MGRKKIEIRPLADERNRNVTFLKRKAGLMKKAWELSVLCTADVSILIFSPSGKPYEFSSKELDGEIDRYLDYEGLIERRRAPEFAAMAADDDEDEQLSRRGSSSRIINLANGAPAKSMKGKESFKSRMTSRAHLARSVNGRKGKGRESEKRAGFIDGILDASSRDGESSGSESEGEGEMPEKKSVVLPGTAHGHGSGVGESSRAQRTVSTSSGLAGLHYAMNFQTHPEPSQSPRSLQPTLNGMYPSYSNHGNIPQLPHLPHPNTHPQPFRTDIPQLPYQPNFSFPPVNYHNVFAPTPPSQPVLPNNMIQWDPNLLSRYAEYRLQQNHQRQQRALLDRQRQQLAELGILSDEKTLMEQLFRAGGTNDTQFAESEQPFEWPDVGQARQAQSRRHDDHGSMFDQKEGIVWPTNEECPLSSPASVDIPRQEKRERERDRGEGREGKRNRVS